jgi:4-hydroxyphenylacetate 3-monooxygenase
MLRTGKQYLDALSRRGGEIYIGGERVDDVVTHPAFRNAAATVARMYDVTSAPENAQDLTYIDADAGRRCNAIFLRPRSKADLDARNRVHEAWARCSWGLFGRSPDHVAGWIAGMACMPEMFDMYHQGFSKNILDYYRHVRDNDLFVTYAVVPPAGAKSADPTANLKQTAAPDAKWGDHAGLRVVKEDDAGLTLWGFKILATGAVLADEILIGNYQPLAKGQEPLAVSCAVPVNTPGLKLLSRRSFEQSAVSEVDNPLAFRYDETDAVVFCDNVRVPWERVFAHNHTDTARAIFNDTPAHVLGNAQAHVRHLAKLRLILGVMAKVLDSNGIANLPPVRDMMGMLATRVAMVESLVVAESAAPETWPNGYVAQDRQAMYSTMAYTMEYYPEFIQTMRELLGSHYFQQPADISVFSNPVTADIYAKFATGSAGSSLERYKLMRLAWDLIGSEFASRHTQYEMFYNGAKHVARARAHLHFRWDVVTAEADRALASFGMPELRPAAPGVAGSGSTAEPALARAASAN